MSDRSAGDAAILRWSIILAISACLLTLVMESTVDRVLASPDGAGWDRRSVYRVAAQSAGLGWAYDLLAADERIPRGEDR